MAVEKRIERELPIVLNAVQREEVATQLAEVTMQRLDEEQTAKDEAGARRKVIKELKKKQTTLAQERQAGVRQAMVPCLEITNWPQSITVVRLDRNEGDPDYVVETRPCEVQAELGDVADRKRAEDAAPTQASLAFETKPDSGADADHDSESEGDEETDDHEDEAEESEDEGPIAADAPPPADSEPAAAASAPPKARRRTLAANAH